MVPQDKLFATKRISRHSSDPDVITELSKQPACVRSPIFEIGTRAVIAATPKEAMDLLTDTLKAVSDVKARNATAVGAVQWELFRMDIHGTEVSMQVFDSQAEADATAKMYQDR